MRTEIPTSPTYTPGIGPDVEAPTRGQRVVAAYVRKLQRHEGHKPCFMTDARCVCIEFDCPWRTDCMRSVVE